MAKRRREPDSNGTTTASAEYNTVFVDTSLDTHLAMLVSNSDTVSDFKRKMVLEHRQCFPEIGEICIHSLKVKRKANFYHLPDIMLVWSAFQGVKGNWFLSADASSTPAHHLNQNSLELGTSDGMKMDVRNVDDNNCRGLSSDVNMVQSLPMPLPDGAETITGSEVEKSLEKANEFQSNNYSEENCVETESRTKKKRRVARHTEDVCHNPSLEDGSPLLHASGNDTSLTVDSVKETPGGAILYQQEGKPNTTGATDEVSGVRNDQCDIENGVVLEGTSAPATAEESNLGSILNSRNLLGSDRSKEETLLENIIPENLMARKVEYELGKDVPIEHSGGVSIRVPDSSGATGDVSSKRNNRKTKKAPKAAKKIQDRTDMEQTTKDDIIKPYTETHTSDKKEEEKDLSLNHDHEIIMPSDSKASEHADPDVVPKGASSGSHFCDANASAEPEISSGSKKKTNKKKGKKSADTNTEKLGMEQTDNGGSGSSRLLCPPTDHIVEETHKEESILYHKEKDVHMTLLDTSTQGASEKVRIADRNEADFLILTQTEQALDDVETGDKKIDEKLSAGNCLAHSPAVEKDNAIVEFNEVEKDIKNPESKNEKSKKKRKKRKLTGSDVQENLPVKDQEVGIEALTTIENSTSFVNSEQEGRHVASLQVLSHKSQEKLEEMQGTPIISDDRARPSESEAEGINFNQYFLTGPYEDKADSGDKKATMSNEEMKTLEKVKENGFPSIGVSTKSQDSLKSSRNQGSEKKTRVKKDSGRRQGESAQSSAWDEVVSNSSRRSSRASKNGVKDSVPSEICETSLQKPKEIRASSCLNEKNPSLDKSSSRKSETVPEKRGNKRSQSGLSVTNKMVKKTPKIKSLLTKPGAIFQVNSGESSGDENGTMHLDGSPGSPSDSSSVSGDSVGKSDLSQDSTRNGSNDAKGRSTGGKSISKLDLSASKDMTMNMILRSSKRFKKAKLQASQNEGEDIEFVPDSQPINL